MIIEDRPERHALDAPAVTAADAPRSTPRPPSASPVQPLDDAAASTSCTRCGALTTGGGRCGMCVTNPSLVPPGEAFARDQHYRDRMDERAERELARLDADRQEEPRVRLTIGLSGPADVIDSMHQLARELDAAFPGRVRVTGPIDPREPGPLDDTAQLTCAACSRELGGALLDVPARAAVPVAVAICGTCCAIISRALRSWDEIDMAAAADLMLNARTRSARGTR